MSELRLNNNNNNNNNNNEQDLMLAPKKVHPQQQQMPTVTIKPASSSPKSGRQYSSHQQLSSGSPSLGLSSAPSNHQLTDQQLQQQQQQQQQHHLKSAQKYHQQSASHQHLHTPTNNSNQSMTHNNNNNNNSNQPRQQKHHQHHQINQTFGNNYQTTTTTKQHEGAGKSGASSGLILAAAAATARQQQQHVVIDQSDSASLPSSGSASTSDSMFKRRRLGGSSRWQRFLASCCCASSPPADDDDGIGSGAGSSDRTKAGKSRSRTTTTLTPLGLLFILLALIGATVLLFHFKLFGLSLTCSLLGGGGGASGGKQEGFNLKNGAEFYLGITEMLQAMDNTVDPCNDFYNYACGAWTRRHSIPGDESRIDTFSVMRTDLGNKLRDLLEEEIDSSDSEATIKAKTLYRSCVNETTIDKRGPEPLLRLLNDQFGGWPLLGGGGGGGGSGQLAANVDGNNNNNNAAAAADGADQQDWVRLMAILRTYNNEIIIGQTVGSHEHNSSQHAIRLYPAGLGLPSADYYNASSRQFKAYENYIVSTAQLLRANNSNLMADIRDVLEFESGLANISKPFERQGGATHHRMTIARLQKYTPAINWDTYFKYSFPDLAINSSEQIGLYGLDFFMDIAHLINTTASKKTVINYLLWRFVMNRVNNLGKQFADNQHEYAAEISGAKQQAPRHKVCADYVNGNMGMAVSSLYVKRHFDAASKQQAEIMIANIRQAFLDILNQVDWMDAETRQEAIVKAKSMLQHIGFPLWITSPAELDQEYQHLNFSSDNYFENVIQLIQSFAKETRIKLRQPSERDKWTVAPSIINAHYLRTKNLMTFPAGILQPPIYHTRYPKSLNYGGIGSIIGHEITHGFDNDGRHHDFQGNQRLWWHPNTIDRFIVRSQCMVRQYDDYNVEIRGENISVSGIRTLGENIADNGGLKEAFMAYRKYELENGPEDTLPGLNLTHHQMFFIKFAQNWCQNMTPQSMMNALKTWRHPLGRFRVIGTLSNLNEFSQAFNCPANSQMNPTNKCKVW